MGQQAISSAQSTFAQMQRLYPNSSATDVWKGMGITVMIGHNDTVPETFTLADARKVRDYAIKMA